jgi:hypothetical protein
MPAKAGIQYALALRRALFRQRPRDYWIPALASLRLLGRNDRECDGMRGTERWPTRNFGTLRPKETLPAPKRGKVGGCRMDPATPVRTGSALTGFRLSPRCARSAGMTEKMTEISRGTYHLRGRALTRPELTHNARCRSCHARESRHPVRTGVARRAGS